VLPALLYLELDGNRATNAKEGTVEVPALLELRSAKSQTWDLAAEATTQGPGESPGKLLGAYIASLLPVSQQAVSGSEC
jgi:hypothetical protein